MGLSGTIKLMPLTPEKYSTKTDPDLVFGA